jgi:hypothetical protein
MKRVGDAVTPLIVGWGLKGAMQLERIRQNWGAFFPGPLTVHAEPQSLRDGHLSVTVDSSAWLHQVRYMQAKILQRLSPLGVKRITVRVGRVTPLHEPRHTAPPPPVRISAEDARFIETLTASVADEALRMSVKRAMTRWATSPHRPTHGSSHVYKDAE